MNAAAGGTDWVRIFTDADPETEILGGVSSLVGQVIVLQHEPFIELPAEDQDRYKDNYASLLQNTGAWKHLSHDGVGKKLIFGRRVLALDVFQLQYTYSHDSYDYLTVVSQQRLQSIVPEKPTAKSTPIPKPVGPAARPAPPAPPTFGARFRQSGQSAKTKQQTNNRTQPNNSKMKRNKQSAPTVTPGNSTIQEQVEAMLCLDNGAIANLFQAEAEAEEEQHQKKTKKNTSKDIREVEQEQEDEDQACKEADEDTDEDAFEAAGAVTEMTLDDIQRRYDCDVIDIPFPNQQWVVVRGPPGPSQLVLGTIYQMPSAHTLHASCRLKHKRPAWSKRKLCDCWVTSRNDFASALHDLVMWLATGKEGVSHSTGHIDAATLITTKYSRFESSLIVVLCIYSLMC